MEIVGGMQATEFPNLYMHYSQCNRGATGAVCPGLQFKGPPKQC